MKKRRRKKSHLKKFVILSISLVLLLVFYKMLDFYNINCFQLAHKTESTKLAVQKKLNDNKVNSPNDDKLSVKNKVIDKKITKKTISSNTISTFKKDNSTNVEDLSNKKSETSLNVNTAAKKDAVNKSSISVNADEAFKKDGQKVAFLTFDDGPSKATTPIIINILKKYNVKATFFVLGQCVESNKDLLVNLYNDGHAIGNHSYTHNYNVVYKDVACFMYEFNKTRDLIKSTLKPLNPNYDLRLFRFPGGSFEKSKNPFKEKLKEENYRYIDWNALNGDAEGHNIPASKLLFRTKETVSGKDHVVILMHDASTKKSTVQALPSIIEYLKSQGYVFKTLQ
ncbi:polysaccharide deacetylase family protein [Haloimpatiens sp. FM7315]|uniref:polysaccharide deacetylase family protein n=1 Tax=Haloimpatiens sp. FM7315 TaxID=3298609 RepID=UPI0035A30E63